jgi:hypothetical protein
MPSYWGTNRGRSEPPKTRWWYCGVCTNAFDTRSRYAPDSCRRCPNTILHDCGQGSMGEMRAAQLVRAAKDKEPNWVGMGVLKPNPPE